MRRIHPFVVGHVIGAIIVGVIAGAVLSVLAALLSAASMAVGAVVSCLICWAWPGLETRSLLLWPVAVFADPVMLGSLGLIAADYECVVGSSGDWGCTP